MILSADEVKNIGLSGISCAIAQTCVHPIETTMVLQQLTKQGSKIRPFPVVMVQLAQREGIGGWYRGITASILRELIYSSLRFGLYEPIRDQYATAIDKDSTAQRIMSRMAAGCTAGGVAAFIACPTEVLKVRAQASSTIPSPFFKLIREVGGSPLSIKPFYEGVGTTVTRAMSIGITKMAVYNEVKDFLKKTPDNSIDRKRAARWQCYIPFLHSWKDSDYKKFCHTNAPSNTERLGLIFTTAFITGFAITCSSSPFTNARTFIMSKPGYYRGMTHAMSDIVRLHGPLGLFRGFSAQWARFGPYALIQFFCWEQLRYYSGLKPI